MVGRKFSRSKRNEGKIIQKEKVLELKNVNTDKIKKISFYLLKGEILRVAGLTDSGRTDILISSENEKIINITNRVMIMSNGK